MKKENFLSEEDIRKLPTDERKKEYQNQYDKIILKRKKLLKTKKILAIAVISSMFIMIGGVAVMISAFAPKTKAKNTVEKAGYQYYNDLHKNEETQKLLDMVESGEISLKEYESRQKKIDNLDEEKFMQEYASAEDYQYYKNQINLRNTLAGVGMGTIIVSAPVMLATAFVADSKGKKYKSTQRSMRNLLDKIEDCDREERQINF